MKSIENLIRRVGRPLLRGPFFRTWVAHQASRLANAYTGLILDHVRRPLPATPSMTPRPALRNLLFICDNMWEKRELLPELQRICSVTFLDVAPWKEPGTANRNERLQGDALRKTLAGFKGCSYDAIIVYLNSALLSDELLAALRHWTCPLIGMNLDDKNTYAPFGIFARAADNYRAFAGRFDVNLTNSRAMLDVYRADGFQAMYLPTGFHLDRTRPIELPPSEYVYPLSFVGSRKPERAGFIEALEARGIHVELFGGGWRGAAFTDDGSRVYRQSQLNLGVGFNLPGEQFTNLKNRDFECPGAGGCYLTTFDWELAELFEIGKEILCYRNIDEFVEVYAYYIRRPDRCRQIAIAGRARASQEHTWEARFRHVFTELGYGVAP